MLLFCGSGLVILHVSHLLMHYGSGQHGWTWDLVFDVLLSLVTLLLLVKLKASKTQQQHLSHQEQQQRLQCDLAELTLQKTEEKFRSIFEKAASGILFLDTEGFFITVNPAYEQLIGYDRQELINKHFTEYTHPEDIAEDRELFAALIRGEFDSYKRTKRYLHKQGHVVWVNLSIALVKDTTGQPEYLLSLAENITDRKLAEIQLLETRNRLQELLKTRNHQLKQINAELSWQANHDPLTHLLNRYEFERRLLKILAELTPNPISNQYPDFEHTLCHFDLDRFKIVNNTCGTLAGDELLRTVAQVLQKRTRHTDLVGRLGGDEFVIVFYQCPLEKGQEVITTIIAELSANPFVWENNVFRITASAGLVPINSNSPAIEEVMQAADAACFAAKKRGTSRVHVYQSDDQELAQHRSEAQWVSRLEIALQNNNFRLYQQKIVPLGSPEQHNAHYELLIRLEENQQIISPGVFLPAAERYHLTARIDTWVIRHFLGYLHQQWAHQNSDRPGHYAINLSGESLNNDTLVDFLREQFHHYQIPPEIICFEITETVAVANLNLAAKMIQEIQRMGCTIALDDFGSGMSSFGYLKYLPVDYLKIDGSFVKDIVEDPIDFAMVETINRIGHVMNIQTIAEYVSNQDICGKLRTIGVDYVQGYSIAKPQPLPGFQSYLQTVSSSL